MAYTKYIWTKHARSSVLARKIPQRLLDDALYSPTLSLRRDGGIVELQKNIDGRAVTILTKKNDRDETIIITAWVNPPYSGTRDAKKRARYLEAQKSGLLKKLWLSLLNGLGL